MVETTYQTTKYQSPGTITEIYSNEIGDAQCHNPRITIKIYIVLGQGTHILTHQALLMLETVLQELVLLWQASLGLCISSPPFLTVSCLTQLHLPLSNKTYHKRVILRYHKVPTKKDNSTRTVKICNFVMLHDFMKFTYRVVNNSTHSSTIAPLSLCIVS